MKEQIKKNKKKKKERKNIFASPKDQIRGCCKFLSFFFFFSFFSLHALKIPNGLSMFCKYLHFQGISACKSSFQGEKKFGKFRKIDR